MTLKYFFGNCDPQHDEILDRIKAHEKAGDKSLVHARVDNATVSLLNT